MLLSRPIALGTIMLALVVGLSVLVGSSMALAGNHQPTVRVVGTEHFRPNAVFNSSFHFAPGDITVKSGEEVTWVHQEQVGAPHTITVVDAADVPDELIEVVMCSVCEATIGAHFGGPTDEIGLDDGLDAAEDSFVIGKEPVGPVDPPSEKTVTVTAGAGTTLNYICAFHPWMQGTIQVVE